MKRYSLLLLCFLGLVWSCSTENNNSNIEDGSNPNPNLKSVGASANAFLSADRYQSISVQILYVGGFQPQAQSIQNLKAFMEARLNKPGGITFGQKEIASPSASPYSINEIADLEADLRSQYNTPNTLSLFILFIDGNYANDTTSTLTLGAAYRNTSCVIFENSVQNLSNAPTEPNRVKLETIVLEHELCHMLGLVDLGSPMQTNHVDPNHSKHCVNPDCLMYFETESNLQAMMAPGIPTLDANCLADLRANGGR